MSLYFHPTHSSHLPETEARGGNPQLRDSQAGTGGGEGVFNKLLVDFFILVDFHMDLVLDRRVLAQETRDCLRLHVMRRHAAHESLNLVFSHGSGDEKGPRWTSGRGTKWTSTGKTGGPP